MLHKLLMILSDLLHAKPHYDLTSAAYGVFSPESLRSLDSLGLAYYAAGQDGLEAKTIAKMISHAKIVYGSNSSEYADILIKHQHGLVGSPREFVDNELLRLELAIALLTQLPDLVGMSF